MRGQAVEFHDQPPSAVADIAISALMGAVVGMVASAGGQPMGAFDVAKVSALERRQNALAYLAEQLFEQPAPSKSLP
jgi:hypothetical protein